MFIYQQKNVKHYYCKPEKKLIDKELVKKNIYIGFN